MRRAYAPYSVQSRRRGARRNHGKPEQERNIPAAFFSLVVGGVFAVAMAEPSWLSIKGGRCNKQHIGLYKVFRHGGDQSQKTLEDLYCMNKNVLFEMRLIAACCTFGILFALVQFGLDTWGTTTKWLRAIRKNATGDIIGVLLCVTIMITCYMVVHEIENNASKEGEIVKVSLDIAFYLILGAGVNAVVATTLNLLRCTCERKPANSDEEIALELLDHGLPADYDLPPMPPAYDL